jgi:hypothetical protein
LCATRHGNTLILVLIFICVKVSKCNANSRKMSVVQSKWALSQGCPQLPVMKTANGAVSTANLGMVDTSGALPTLSRRASGRVVIAVRRELHGHLLQAMNCITKRAPGA